MKIAFWLASLVAVSFGVSGAECTTSYWDMLPLLSQIKSGFQLLSGDLDGALQTQDNFFNDGFVTSQARSVYALVTGRPGEAWAIQKEFGANLGQIVDCVPVLGHAKGIMHFVLGQPDEGWAAVKQATSTTGAVAGGVIAGPVGAIAGHLWTDAAIGIVDGFVSQTEPKTHGVFTYLSNIENASSGDHFDALAAVGTTGVTGKFVRTKPVSRVLAGDIPINSPGFISPFPDGEADHPSANHINKVSIM